MKLTWEDVEDDQAGYTFRAKVEGGWLYRHVNDLPVSYPDGEIRYGLAWGTDTCFVPSAE